MELLRFTRTKGMLLAFLLAGFVSPAVMADDLSQLESEVQELSRLSRVLKSHHLAAGGFRGKHHAAERLIDGENFYRLKDYQRAAIILMDIIETYPNHAAYPDALFYFADSLFLSQDYYGARLWYRKLLDNLHLVGAKQYQERALGRLIEIAVHLNDFAGADVYFRQLGGMPSPETFYVRGKYLYFSDDLEAAKSEFLRVKDKLELELKAAYFIGVILTKQKNYESAIKVFQKAVGRETLLASEREVVDLLNLGMGRLYYESGYAEKASAAYQSIEQYSPYYDTALYELASVYVRSGDTTGAERILEVLTLSIPDSKYIPSAKLLRGNLLLRAGRYSEAERVFEETIGEFTPVRNQLTRVMKEQKDTSLFFKSLVERSMSSMDVSGILPPLVVKWVGEERDVIRALDLTSDLGIAQEYTKEIEKLVRLIEAVVNGPSRINAIPAYRNAARRSQQLANRVAQLRNQLMIITYDRYDDIRNVGQLEQQRKQISKQVAALPVTNEQYAKREYRGRTLHTRMKHELARNVARLDKMVAVVVALERYLDDPRYIAENPKASMEALRGELSRYRAEIRGLRNTIEAIREDVEVAELQIGVGDEMDIKDRKIRRRMAGLCKKEVGLVSGQKRYGPRIKKIATKLDQIHSLVMSFMVQIHKEADVKVRRIRQQVASERNKVGEYKATLQTLNVEAEDVVGGVTFENFSNVRKRFHQLILKADVGIIDVAWMRKELHKSRGTSLTKKKLSEIENLKQEFQEVRSEKEK